jgi:hypothetical protein
MLEEGFAEPLKVWWFRELIKKAMYFYLPKAPHALFSKPFCETNFPFGEITNTTLF